MATLDHPNIISYYDSFEREGILMIGIKKNVVIGAFLVLLHNDGF